MSTTSKHFLTVILQQLGHIEATTSTAPSLASSSTSRASILSNLKEQSAEQARSSLLTLHFLFPHELLPALDILDRRLVNSLRHQHRNSQSESPEVFYVQSASAVTEPVSRRSAVSRFRNAWSATKIHYEVRLDSWNCSCAAFAQSQLKLLLGKHDVNDKMMDVAISEDGLAEPQPWFGGRLTKPDSPAPVCKHILAAAIANAAPNLFTDGFQVQEVSEEEIAAWSAGWGEG